MYLFLLALLLIPAGCSRQNADPEELAAVFARRWMAVAAGFALLCGLVAEGPWSRLCAALVWAALLIAGARLPAPYGVMNLSRLCLLALVATLAILSWTAAEPYGRYLAGLLPALAYLVARGFSSLACGRAPIVAGIIAAAAGGNLFFVGPLKAAQALSAPAAAAESVSGMMRRRLRDLPARADLGLFAAEVFRGPQGYIEAAAAALKSGGETFFSDEDALSLMFATRLRPVYPDEFKTVEPDWLMPSPWIRLSVEEDARVRELLASGRYEPAAMDAPRLLWQNNPDPLFHDFSARRGLLPLFRRRSPRSN